MLLQRLRRHLRSQQTRLAIRPQRPWWWRWAGRALTLALCCVLILGGLHWYGNALLGPLRLQAENQRLADEQQKLSAELLRAQQSLALVAHTREEDRAARASLAQELAILREENLHLKEDLGSLRSLMAPGAAGGGVRLSGFRVHAGVTPGEYRWHLLLAQGGHQAGDFRGKVRLRLEYAAGESREPQFPVSDSARDGAQPLSFKYYEDLEGSFRIASGRHLRKVWAEVWRDGETQPAASQAFALP
jgi:hypothetical protein